MGQYHEAWAFDARGTLPAECVTPHALGAGAKLGEQAYLWDGAGWDSETRTALPSQFPPGVKTTSPYLQAIGLMMLGAWAGRRLIVIGDYAESGDVGERWAELAPESAWYGSGRYPVSGDDDDDSRNAKSQAIDVTPLAKKVLGEATGWSTAGSGWEEIVAPDDLGERIARLAAIQDDDEYVLVSDIGEYLDPKRFESPTVRLSMFTIGAVWPVAYGMLACSDGRGGGDLNLQHPGRWAYSVLGTLPRAVAVEQGLTDVSDWALAQERVQRWILGDE